VVSDAGELERLRKEAAELRALVRELSARQAAAVSALPLDAALALAKGGEAGLEPPFRLEHGNETIEMSRADVASEMALLWRRLPPRETA
jgi:anti-sigma factor ChrR (cupin superfamily)